MWPSEDNLDLMRFFHWLKDVFKNDDIVSALSGTEVEPPFYDHDRQVRARVWTGVLYFGLFMGALVLSSIVPEAPPEERWDPPGLVFVYEPGPGGGGGGGDGTDEPESELQIQGEDVATVAVNVETPEEELIFDDPDKPNIEEPEEEEIVEEEEAPEIKAPVVAKAPDDVDTLGALEGLLDVAANAGSGTGGGIGEGEGSGLGPGTGGGFGGGAYRIGSGINPPQLVKRVQPSYTEEAHAQKVQGEVLLEAIIGKDGKIGDVRILRGLGAGLNQQAIECVRQWVFDPATLIRTGEPVDVFAEIVVSFTLL